MKGYAVKMKIMKSYNYQVDCYRKVLKKYGYKGNTSYGLALITDLEGWLNYLCKAANAEPPRCQIQGKHTIVLESHHEVWWIKNKEISTFFF